VNAPDLREFGVERYDGAFESALLNKLAAGLRERASDLAFLRRVDVPWSPPRAPLRELRVALITTAGLHTKDDAPFRTLYERFGDPSFRVVPHLAKPEELALDAGYVDPKYTAHDPECSLPMRALEALHRARAIGAPAAHHYGFAGGLIRPYPGLERSAGEVAESMRRDGAQAAVVIPNCSICVQTAALVACELEARGFATVCYSLIPELSKIVGAPRTLAVHFPFGAPCGDPGNVELQRAVLAEALELLESAREPREVRPTRQAWRKSPV
jgi:D-proline reductase (dithiol) PrdB